MQYPDHRTMEIDAYEGSLKLNFLSHLAGQSGGVRRSALLKLAIASSALSKVFGLGLQAIAIPLVYHSLGQHRYALYLLLTASLATIALAQMGAGPGLTQGIAKANAAGDHQHEAALLSAASRMTLLAAFGGGAILTGIIRIVPPAKLFGSGFSSDRGEILAIMNVCVLVLIAQIVFGIVDSALAGYQEQVLTNLGAMLANIIGIAALILVCKSAPNITRIILVIFGVPILPRIVNLVVLLKRRPYLLKGLARSSRGSYGMLLNVGLAFWVIQVGSVLEQHSGTYILAHLSSTGATDLFAMVYRSISLAAVAVLVFTQPLWPAFVDAMAHHDIHWVRRSYEKIRRVLIAYSCVVGVVLVTVGPWIFQRLLHIETTGYYGLFAVLGVYFIANVWAHILYVVMMGLQIWKVAITILSENVLMVAFGIVLVPHFGPVGMALAYLLASLVLPAWLLPRMFSEAIDKISEPVLATAAIPAAKAN
jgi:O-antigen/teichoic acid export membrane protein